MDNDDVGVDYDDANVVDQGVGHCDDEDADAAADDDLYGLTGTEQGLASGAATDILARQRLPADTE